MGSIITSMANKKTYCSLNVEGISTLETCFLQLHDFIPKIITQCLEADVYVITKFINKL